MFWMEKETFTLARNIRAMFRKRKRGKKKDHYKPDQVITRIPSLYILYLFSSSSHLISSHSRWSRVCLRRFSPSLTTSPWRASSWPALSSEMLLYKIKSTEKCTDNLWKRPLQSLIAGRSYYKKWAAFTKTNFFSISTGTVLDNRKPHQHVCFIPTWGGHMYHLIMAFRPFFSKRSLRTDFFSLLIVKREK